MGEIKAGDHQRATDSTGQTTLGLPYFEFDELDRKQSVEKQVKLKKNFPLRLVKR